MKTRKIVYLIIGALLIFINSLMDLVNYNQYQPEKDTISYNIGYFLGGHIFLVIGLILLRLAYKLHRKIRNTEGENIEETINNIGKDIN